MAKKITIKALCDGVDGAFTQDITGELYESGGFQFCVHYSDDGKQINATEIITGLLVHWLRRGSWVWNGESLAPRRDLLAKIDKFVASGELQAGIDNIKRKHEEKRAELQRRLDSFPAMPINEPIKQAVKKAKPIDAKLDLSL